MDTTLYIKSSFEGYSMILYRNTKPRDYIFFTNYTFTTDSSKGAQLQKSRLQSTYSLIEHARQRGISSIKVRFRGPLGFSPLHIKMLESYGINITNMVDLTIIPHNLGHQSKRIKFEKKATVK